MRVKRFYFSRIKKGEGQGKEKCHAKSMMSNGVKERLKYTLSMCHLGRTRRKKYEGRTPGIEAVWDDTNEYLKTMKRYGRTRGKVQRD